MAGYIHLLPGRMRLPVPLVQGSQPRADEVERLLAAMSGITRVTANPLTGNVLILFDEQRVGAEEIVQNLRQRGYLDGRAMPAPRPEITHLQDVAVNVLAEFMVEAGLKLLFSAIF